MKEIDWADIEDTNVNMAINCLLNAEELYEIDHISDNEGSAEESGDDESRNEDHYESEEEEEESDG